ncbi:hypothetical protein L3X38_010731 [Prunus dulcis]|uniref:GAG-pre-integrase domain-containing protein n=1 Tax=Prunus dulcis TaxID=3755 RepID=A0AAD4WG66_PRUDU|nr:hypothetical protein L3X38_010731 [Prunus dulcis]
MMPLGIGKRRVDLYYFEETYSAGFVFQVNGDHTSEPEKIRLWHRRLGHPSFLYFERLFPSLFTKVLSSSLRCEHCVLAKNHHVTFPSSSNKSEQPFAIVNTDVWGLLSFPTSANAK